MGGLNSGPGPGITLLIAIVLVLTQTASSAPLYEEDEGQESNSQALAESHGCYYNFQHYNEGERILTNEPCLNCTCRNRMLMCYLRMCPFTKGIGQNCTVEKVPGQCCPIITCPEVPVQLLTSTTTEGIKTHGSHHGTKGTAVGHLDTNGCNIDGIFYPNGAQVPGSPERPCELCYCIRNKTACIMQECALHVDGCRPVYEEGQCFPVRYQCDDSPYEEEPTTTVRPPPTPGLIITTTSSEPLDCTYNNEFYEDGSRIQTEDPCEHCYCLKGKIACAVQECGAPLEKEGQNCTALPPSPGKCCPDSYQCDNNTIIQGKEHFPRKDKKHKFDPKHLEHNDITMASQGNESSGGTTEAGIPSVADAGHPTDGYHPDQGTRTTEEPKQTTDRLHQVAETETASKGTPDVKPQELDKGTQNESTESHLEGLHPMKPSSASDYDHKITFPDSGKPSTADEEAETRKPESATQSQVIHMSQEKQPHPESDSHKQDVSTKVPGAPDHLYETDPKHPPTPSTDPTLSHGQNAFDPTTNDVLQLQTSSSTIKDPLLDKLHNIIQDVQSQVTDGKTTEMTEEVDYQTTPQTQTGHFTDKPDILSHIPHFGSQSGAPGTVETGNTTSESSPEDSNNIINKLQDIIQGIYSNVADSVMPSKTSQPTTVATETQPGHPALPDDGSDPLSTVPANGSKPVVEDSGKPEEDQLPSLQTTGKPKPEHELYMTVHPQSGSKHPVKTHPESQHVTKYPEGTVESEEPEHSGKPDPNRPQGPMKLPQRPESGSAEKPHKTDYSETTEVAEEESHTTENPYVTDRTDQTKYPGEGTEDLGDSGVTKKPFDKEGHPAEHKPFYENLGGEHPEPFEVTGRPQHQSSEKLPSEKYPGQHSSGIHYPQGVNEKPDDESLSAHYPDGSETTGKFPEELKPGQQYPTGVRPIGQYPEKTKPFGTEETPYSTEYPESGTGRPEGIRPTGQQPAYHRPGQYPDRFKPTGHPYGSRPTGQYPEKTKPFGTEETPYGTEYPEGATGRPEDYTNYTHSSSEQPAEDYKPGQYSEEFKPSGHYGGKPTVEEPEKHIPGQHTEKFKPTGQYPDKQNPSEKYPHGSIPTEQYPHEVRPTGHYSEVVRPGQKYPEASGSNLQYPFETEETPYVTEYPEGVSRKPSSETPSGHYTEKFKPEHNSDGQRPSDEHSPGTEEIPHGTHPEGATNQPEDHIKYPASGRPTEPHIKVKPGGQLPEDYKPTHYPNKASPTEQSTEGFKPTEQYPEDLKPGQHYPEDNEIIKKPKPSESEDTALGTEYPEVNTDKPESFTKYPESVHPTGLQPEEYKPDQYPEELEPTGHYPQKHKPGQFTGEFKPLGQHPAGVRPTGQYPEKTKPFGTEETPYGTEYPESGTGRPADYIKYPGGDKTTEKYPEGLEPSSHYPHEGKPTVEEPEKHIPGQYIEKYKPTEQYPEKTKPFGTEETPYGTEYPESGTGRPEESQPENHRPGQYPDRFKPTGQHPYGSRPTGQYPEKTKPFGTEETPYGTEYSEGATDRPEDFTTYHPEGLGSVTDQSEEEFTSGDNYPTKVGHQPDRPGTSESSGHLGDGKHPEKKKPTESSEKMKPSKEHPEENSSKYPEGSENVHGVGKPVNNSKYPSGSFRPGEVLNGTEPAEGGVTGKPDFSTNHPEEASPISGRPQKPEKQTESELYSTDNPKESGVPNVSTDYSEGIKPGKPSRPEFSTKRPESEYEYIPSSKYPEETGTFKPADEYLDEHKPIKIYPESTKRPSLSSAQHPETTTRPDDSGTKHPEKTPYGTEYPEIVTDATHDDGSKPTIGSKYPVTGNYPTGSEITSKPEDENEFTNISKYPVTDEPHRLKPKPGSGDEYPETTRRPDGKPLGTEQSEGFEPAEDDKQIPSQQGEITKKPVAGSKYPEEASDTKYSTARPALSELEDEETGTESGLESYLGVNKRPLKPNSGDGTEYPQFSEITDKPQEVTDQYVESEDIKYSKKPNAKPTMSQTSETGGVTESFGSDNIFEEGVTGKPEDLAKYPEKTQRPGYTKEGSTESEKYPEEAYVTHYPEKPEPPIAEDQLLETGAKPVIPVKHPEKKKPESEKNETSKPEEELKPSLPGQPLKPGTYDHSESFTKTPHHPLKQPSKPSDPQRPERPYQSKPFFPGETGATEKPQDLNKNSEKPDYGHKHPEGSKYPSEHPGISGTSDYPTESATELPVGVSKHPDKHENGTDGTEHAEASTDRPEESGKLPQSPEHPEGEVTGRPQDQIKYPEKPTSSGHSTQRPYDTKYPEGVKGKPSDNNKHSEVFRPTGESQGTEYPEEVPGSQEGYTKFPDEFTSTGQYPTVTGKPQDHVNHKFPESFRPIGKYPEKTHDSESTHGTGYPVGITNKPKEGESEKPGSSTIYPGVRPTEQHSGKPQGTDKYPHDSKPSVTEPDTENPERVTYVPEDGTKYPEGLRPTQEPSKHPESYTPAGQHPGNSHGTDKPEEDLESPYGTEYSEGVTGKPEHTTKYSGGLRPSGVQTKRPDGSKPFSQYPVKQHGTDKFSEADKSHSETEYPEEVTSSSEYPGFSSTGKPQESFKPTGHYPGRPQVSDKYPEEGNQESVYGTEYPEGVTKRPDDTIKYPGGFKPPGRPYPEAGKPLDPGSLHGTEYPEGVTKGPEDSTEYTDGLVPTGFYPGQTERPDDKTKYPTGQFPGSELSYSTDYPEGVTGRPNDQVKYPDGFKPIGHHPENPQETNKYPEEGKPHESPSPYPGGEDYTKYPSEPEEFTPTEHPEYTSRPHGSDRHPEVETEAKPTEIYSEYDHSQQTGKPFSHGRPDESDELTKHPDGVEPDVVYPGGVTEGKPHGAHPETNEQSETGTEKPDNETGATDRYPVGSKHPVTDGSHELEGKPHGTEYPVTSGFPVPGQQSGHPDEGSSTKNSQKPESEIAGVTVRPNVSTKLPASDDEFSGTLYPEVGYGSSTEYTNEKKPEFTGVTGEPDQSKNPESGKHPQKQKPIESNDIVHITAYPDGLEKVTESNEVTEHPEPLGTKYPEGVTRQPEDAVLYPGINKRPSKYPQKPKPESEKEPQQGAGPGEPEQPELENEPHETEYSEKPDKTPRPGIEHSHDTEVTEGDAKVSEKPFETKHPLGFHTTDQYPEGVDHQKPDDSFESQDVVHSGTTEELDETENTLRPEMEKNPESSVGTHKRPQKPKPIGGEPFGSDHITTEEPDVLHKYPEEKPKPSPEYPESGEEGKPGKHPEEHEPVDVDTYGTELPEEQKPAGNFETEAPEEAAGKPVDGNHPDPLGVAKYPGRPTHEYPESELSTKYPSHVTTSKPGTAYLPLDGQLPSEKIPSSEHLGEDSVPDVSEHSVPTETVFGFTDKIPAGGYPSEENLLSNLHHFENLPDKPPSADLTHKHQAPGQHSTSKYPEKQPTSQSSIHDLTSGKPKPNVPGEGEEEESFNEKDSTYTSESPSVTRRPSTASPGTKHPGPLRDPTGDKYPEDVSASKPEDTNHKDSVTEQSHDAVENLQEPTEDLPERPTPSDATAVTSQGVENSSPEVEKTTSADNDLINKLHSIISGIQSQVTDGKTTSLPHEDYDTTSPFGLATESSTDKFGRPEKKPTHGQVPDISTDEVSPFENEIYDQTTAYVEDSEMQTNGPDFVYPFGEGSTEHSVGIPSKGPEGINLNEPGNNAEEETITKHPPVSKPDETQTTEYPKPGKPSLGEYPTDKLSEKPNESFSSTESLVSGTPSGHVPGHGEILEGSPHPPLATGQESSTRKPDQVIMENAESTPSSPTDQIHQHVKEDKKPTEDTDSAITEVQQPVTGDALHTVTPLDPSHRPTSSSPTDKPLHVVYPTYYPEGVVTRKPGAKPDEGTDKKVTVTPQSIPTSDSDSFGAPQDETHTVYDVQTEISSESSTSAPVVVVQEVHTEVHSERATTKPETEGYVKQTTEPGLESTPKGTGDELTKYPESPGKVPQVVFGRPPVTQPSEDEFQPESQTLQPLGGYSESEKFPSLLTDPVKPESTTKPGLVTVTPVGFNPVTKESEHIMHLYSPKDKLPGSGSSPQYLQPSSTTEKEQTSGFTESQPAFVTDSGATYKPELLGTRFPSRKTTQKPTDGVPLFSEEGTTITPTQGIGGEYLTSHFEVTKRPPFVVSTEGLPTESTEHATSGEETMKGPQGASYVPYKLINRTKVYYPEKETSQQPPSSDPSPFDGYDHIPYEIINATKFFYPNRAVTPQPAFTTTTAAAQMGMYVPYKIVNGTKIYYTQDKPKKPEKFDGLDYVPFDIVNGTKVFYPERVTTAPPPTSAMYVPFKIINDTKVYYPKDAQEEPQDIPDEYDGFDYIPFDVVDGKKIFRPDRLPGHVPATTERPSAMYVPYKLINGKKVYYPKDAQTEPEFLPEGYDGYDFVPYEVINGTKVFQPEQTTQPLAMFVPYKKINGTKVYFPKYAQLKPTHTHQGYDGFDYLPYEEVNGTKIFRPVTPKPEYASTPAFYPNGMFVPYKIIDNKKVFFPNDAQHKPRPLKSGYDGVQYLSYDVINGTKVFYTEEATTPAPVESSMYVPFKLINGTKVYYADKATENPERIPDGFEGFDYLPFETVNGNKVFYPDRVASNMGMYVPYKKINGTKVYYPKDSTEKEQSVPEGYNGVDYIPYEIINGTKVFYPDRATATKPSQIMYVPYKMVNGTKVYYPKDAQPKPSLVPEGYDGFDSLPYEVVNGTKVFHPGDVTKRPTPGHSQGMFVPYKIINGTKVYYPQEAHKRPHPLSDEYAGLDYIPYEVVNGTKVFHPESVTPATVPAMYVPYKLINGTKVFYPEHAQHTPQQVPTEYDGLDYVPYEIVNKTQVFYPNRVPSYQGMYVPFKIVNGEKVFYPKYAQHKPSTSLEGYDGFDYLPYENLNGTKVFRPVETITETPFEQAMYVPYKLINGTKVFYPKYAQFRPYLIPEGYDGFEYIPFEIVNGTKVFNPEQAAKPYKPAMYVPFKIVNGKKVYYPKYAQNKPHLVPDGYDGFDYIPYEIVNGTKVFDPQHAKAPGTTYKPSLFVPYKLINGMKIYQPKFAQKEPTEVPQGYDGFDFLPYDIIHGNKVFYPEQSTPVKQAMYVPYKMVNGTKVFYPKYAQYVPTQTSEGFDGSEYIPYEVVNGEKVFHPEEAIKTPFKQAMYVPYKVVNGTKVYYSKYAQYDPLSIPPGYEGFDYLPYEVINGNKVFHPEQAAVHPFRKAMYVPFRIVNGTKIYYPNYAQSKPEFIPEGYHGFDYLPYELINGTKVFDPKAPTKPTYLEGMYVPYKLSNNTKVFYPKDAHNKPNRVPPGYDGADYVPYEVVNNTKMFYPELISTAQPSNTGSAGVYVPFKIINKKKVFYPKEATPFPPTVRHPYDGVAFVPNKAQPMSEIVYVDNEEALKVFQPGQVPGEGSCYLNNRTFANNSEIPPVSPCQTKCFCVSSVVHCVRVKCPSPPENKLDCSPVYREGSCCPIYACGDSEYEYSTTVGYPELHESSSSTPGGDETTPFADFEVGKKPPLGLGGVKGGVEPEEESSSGEYHLHKPPKPKPGHHESLEPYDNVEGQLSPDEDYDIEDEEPYGPGTCRYAGKVYVSAQQIPRDDPCDFCFCFRSDIICLQQSCPPPIPGCRDEPIQGFCCPRYECHVKMATLLNVTSTTTTTTTTLPPHFFPHAFKGTATRTGCFVQGRAYRVGQPIPSASGPCMDCICGGNGRMKCEPKVCTPEPMIRKMISPSENSTFPTDGR